MMHLLSNECKHVIDIYVMEATYGGCWKHGKYVTEATTRVNGSSAEK